MSEQSRQTDDSVTKGAAVGGGEPRVQTLLSTLSPQTQQLAVLVAAMRIADGTAARQTLASVTAQVIETTDPNAPRHNYTRIPCSNTLYTNPKE